jgi:phosphatidylglycerophosphatase A
MTSDQKRPETRSAAKFISLGIATGIGVGYSPLAPGTCGTLLAVPIYLVLSRIPSPLYELTLGTLLFLSIWSADQAEKHLGRKDDRRIVIDEIVGFLVTMLWLPPTPLMMITGFLFFRFFDILKPFPIRQLERRVKGGLGVTLDDVLAGVFSNVLLHLVYAVAG